MKIINIGLTRIAILLAGLTFLSSVNAVDDLPEISHDGLVLLKDSKMDVAYALPGVDLSGYDKLIILEPHIAFVKNWQRDKNRELRAMGSRVRDKDIERMIRRGKDLFEHAFTDVLEEGGYDVVKDAGEGVLIVKPAIINLDVAAPDVQSTGRSRTYVANAGSATMYIELYDSVTGQILVRAFDSRRARNNSYSWSMSSSSVSNQAAANRGLTYWAGLLKTTLDKAKKSDN